ncbi:UNVERIFIED_CONTAM: hypothetical protein GTU68_008285 [Idotea baltica]|nr:hypothetical protein [Idotea baltica]
MRPVAEACVAAGHTVEMPRLPGHGTTVDDMLTTSWADWSAHVEGVYEAMAARCERVFVVGLSMGGALTLWLASRHSSIAGIVVINSAGEPNAERTSALEHVVASGQITVDAIGNDIAMPGVIELAYDKTPLAPLLSLVHAVNDFDLAAITCPTMVMVSDQDHVVPPETATYIADHVGSQAQVVRLTKSYHVATLDYDAAFINSSVVDFIADHS